MYSIFYPILPETEQRIQTPLPRIMEFLQLPERASCLPSNRSISTLRCGQNSSQKTQLQTWNTQNCAKVCLNTIRRSELVGLNLNDVYEDRIRVVGKGNKERTVYFGSACRKAIDAYLPERHKRVLTDNRALFGSRDNNRISVSAVHRLIKKYLLMAGLDPDQFSAHKLRHTAATMMLSGGVDVKTVQEVLGHENLNTTQIYTHIENTELKIAAEANPLSKINLDRFEDE